MSFGIGTATASLPTMTKPAVVLDHAPSHVVLCPDRCSILLLPGLSAGKRPCCIIQTTYAAWISCNYSHCVLFLTTYLSEHPLQRGSDRCLSEPWQSQTSVHEINHTSGAARGVTLRQRFTGRALERAPNAIINVCSVPPGSLRRLNLQLPQTA